SHTTQKKIAGKSSLSGVSGSRKVYDVGKKISFIDMQVKASNKSNKIEI
ncbi:3947_t:CDS:1, partial [Entrophospora sp. SA101]